MKLLAGRPAVVRVLREVAGTGDSKTSTMTDILTPPAFHLTFGLKMKMGEVAAVRSPASDKVKEGDVIVSAKVTQDDRTLGEVAARRARPGAPALRAGKGGGRRLGSVQGPRRVDR